MSYNKDDLEKKALAVIKRNKIKFITHVAAFLPCSERTFFNKDLQDLQSIKDAIETNRIGAKVKALNRWEKSKNPTLEVAFYKLIADDDEAHRLNGSKTESKDELTIKEHRIIKPKTNDSNEAT